MFENSSHLTEPCASDPVHSRSSAQSLRLPRPDSGPEKNFPDYSSPLMVELLPEAQVFQVRASDCEGEHNFLLNFVRLLTCQVEGLGIGWVVLHNQNNVSDVELGLTGSCLTCGTLIF